MHQESTNGDLHISPGDEKAVVDVHSLQMMMEGVDTQGPSAAAERELGMNSQFECAKHVRANERARLHGVKMISGDLELQIVN